MNSPININELILSIVSYVNEKDGYVTKTKLVKYLYLLDVEYYREFGRQLTNLNWIFYKFGPYTNEFEDVYKLLSKSKLKIKKHCGAEHDAEILTVDEKISIKNILPDPSFRVKARDILNQWGKQKLSKMLDYVYFETEPMENPQKKQPLDFSTIELQKSDYKYVIPKTKSNFKKLQKRKEKIKKSIIPDKFIPLEQAFKIQEYDNSYWKDIDNFNLEDEY